MKKLFIILCIIILNINSSFADEIQTIDLTNSKWEYRWGDSDFKNDIPKWTIENENSKEWKEIKFPSNPPNRALKTNAWFRVKIPDNLMNNPILYISSIDLISQFYYKKEQIYHFGNFNEEGKGKFSGWPWHKISLPQNSSGEYLYIRVYSNYLDIGLWGEILILSESDLYKKLLNTSMPKIMVGSVSIFVGVILFLSFLSRWKRVELLILGLLFLAQGADLLVSAKIIELYLYFPLLKQYILASVFFFFPIGMALYMDKTIKEKVPFNLIGRLWQIHVVYFICAIAGSLLGFYSLPSTYEYFDILYNFISLPILTFFMIYFFYKGDKETKIITFSFFIISIYWLYSYLVASGIITWNEVPGEIAIFSCLLLLSYSIINKLNYTDDLEKEKNKLKIISTLDYLTKLNNRKEIDSILETNELFFKRYKDTFSLILLDIDDFKNVNDVHGHLVGDKVLIDISEILKKNTRKVDIVGRWGGEEFVIICPKTKEEEAFKIAEKLRTKIERNKLNIAEYKTASFGISSYKENDSILKLLERADKAMYHSKKEGKNRITII